MAWFAGGRDIFFVKKSTVWSGNAGLWLSCPDRPVLIFHGEKALAFKAHALCIPRAEYLGVAVGEPDVRGANGGVVCGGLAPGAVVDGYFRRFALHEHPGLQELVEDDDIEAAEAGAGEELLFDEDTAAAEFVMADQPCDGELADEFF